MDNEAFDKFPATFHLVLFIHFILNCGDYYLLGKVWFCWCKYVCNHLPLEQSMAHSSTDWIKGITVSWSLLLQVIPSIEQSSNFARIFAVQKIKIMTASTFIFNWWLIFSMLSFIGKHRCRFLLIHDLWHLLR